MAFKLGLGKQAISLAKVSASSVRSFYQVHFSSKVNFSRSQFLAKVLASPQLWCFFNSSLVSMKKSGL